MATKRNASVGNTTDLTGRTSDTAEAVREKARDLADSASETLSGATERVRSAARNINTDQLRSAYNRVPKPISPKVHAWIDYFHAGTFFVAAAVFARRNRRASLAAGLIGGSVLMNALMTNYPGGVFRTWSFKTHGLLDIGVAGVSAIAPELHGFSGEPEAAFFRAMGAGEAGVVAMTDYGYDRLGDFDSPYLDRDIA